MLNNSSRSNSLRSSFIPKTDDSYFIEQLKQAGALERTKLQDYGETSRANINNAGALERVTLGEEGAMNRTRLSDIGQTARQQMGITSREKLAKLGMSENQRQFNMQQALARDKYNYDATRNKQLYDLGKRQAEFNEFSKLRGLDLNVLEGGPVDRSNLPYQYKQYQKYTNDPNFSILEDSVRQKISSGTPPQDIEWTEEELKHLRSNFNGPTIKSIY